MAKPVNIAIKAQEMGPAGPDSKWALKITVKWTNYSQVSYWIHNPHKQSYEAWKAFARGELQSLWLYGGEFHSNLTVAGSDVRIFTEKAGNDVKEFVGVTGQIARYSLEKPLLKALRNARRKGLKFAPKGYFDVIFDEPSPRVCGGFLTFEEADEFGYINALPGQNWGISIPS
jgi:hypothetical protein